MPTLNEKLGYLETSARSLMDELTNDQPDTGQLDDRDRYQPSLETLVSDVAGQLVDFIGSAMISMAEAFERISQDLSRLVAEHQYPS